jgi:hypothetical protein
MAERILADGKADMVCMTRAHLADPLFAAGDCVAPRSCLEAIREGYGSRAL